MDDLSGFCCQNPECSDYGKRGAGNLSVSMYRGRVAPGDCSPGAPADPDVQDYRIRFLK